MGVGGPQLNCLESQKLLPFADHQASAAIYRLLVLWSTKGKHKHGYCHCRNSFGRFCFPLQGCCINNNMVIKDIQSVSGVEISALSGWQHCQEMSVNAI